MKLAWELFINAIEVFLIYDFLIRYFGYRVKDVKSYLVTALTVSASFITVSVISYIVTFEVISAVLMVFINFVFCLVVLKGNIFEKLFFSIFIMASIILIASVVPLSFGVVFYHNVWSLYSVFGPVRMSVMIMTKIVLLMLTRLILKLRFRSDLSFQEFLILLILPFFSLVAVAFLMPVVFNNADIQNSILISIFIIVIMNILIYILFLRLSWATHIKKNYDMLRLQYVSEQKRIKEIKQLYEEIHSIRHDLKNHLICIDLLAKQGKYNEISDYIQKFSKEINNIEKNFLFTGNDVLDAILNTKISLAEQEGIRCTAEINCGVIPLEQWDISVLIGNLLDNAYEAARQAEEKNIYVRIVLQGNYVHFCVENTIASSVLAKNPDLKTSKNNKSIHGLGTKNVRRIVEKYGGILDYHEEGNIFSCDILFPFRTNYDI